MSREEPWGLQTPLLSAGWNSRRSRSHNVTVAEPWRGRHTASQSRTVLPLQPSPGAAAARAFRVRLTREDRAEQPVTQRGPRAVHTRRCRRPQLVHGHYLQNVGRESLSTPSGLICSLPTDPMDCSTPGLPVSHRLPELTQVHLPRVSDAIQPSHPLPPPPFAFSLSQHQGLFQWVGSSHQIEAVELQLQHQSFQWVFRVGVTQD